MRFNNKDTVRWFESRGVPLIIRDDLRVFPESNDAGSIVNCLISEAKRLDIEIYTSRAVKEIEKSGDVLRIIFEDLEIAPELFNKVIVTTGGSPKRSGLNWLEKLGHKIEEPVPSLFTFNIPGEKIAALMGVSVDKSIVRIQGTKLLATGPLLITHWGMSGPSILKLSSFGARILHDMNYSFNIQVNWAGEINNDRVMDELVQLSGLNPRKMLVNLRPFNLPERLWQFLLRRIELPEDKTWGETGKKGLNRIVSILTNDVYKVDGRTTFKEEFVTCGGISLDSVDMNTMESKVCKNLYFAGEVLDIDAITGGFNLQAAWTTGWIAGKC
jgi:predicted Rossmann fold flavoprotein